MEIPTPSGPFGTGGFCMIGPTATASLQRKPSTFSDTDSSPRSNPGDGERSPEQPRP